MSSRSGARFFYFGIFNKKLIHFVPLSIRIYDRIKKQQQKKRLGIFMTDRTKTIVRTALLGGALFCGISFLLPGCKEKEEDGKLDVLSAVNAVSPVMPDEDLELLYHSDFYFDRLGYREQKIYINMLRACRDMKDVTYFDSVDEDTFLKADYAIFADHPEITWRWSYSGNYAGTVDTV